MRLENYILKSIFSYPRVYYSTNYNESRRLVLNHLFLVVGAGVKYTKESGGTFTDGSFGERSRNVSKKILQRVKTGETLLEVANALDSDALKNMGMALPFRNYYNNDSSYKMFYSDFIQQKHVPKYVLWGTKLGRNFDSKNVSCVELFPKRDEFKHWHPYPFSLQYLPFYDKLTKRLMPKESIAPDWREGIVEIYKYALNWFEDDNLFGKDYHYNWADVNWDRNNIFVDNWNKSTNKLKFCDDYGIPRKKYKRPRDMARDIVKKNRDNYIKEAKIIIKQYS